MSKIIAFGSVEAASFPSCSQSGTHNWTNLYHLNGQCWRSSRHYSTVYRTSSAKFEAKWRNSSHSIQHYGIPVLRWLASFLSGQHVHRTCFKFLLWGYLKNRVFSTSSWTWDELHTRITDEIYNISQVILKKVFRNTIVVSHVPCINADYGHFQYLLQPRLSLFCIWIIFVQ